MARIIQGEQYAIKIEIYNEDAQVTPENCDDIKIKVGTIEKTHSAGELSYSTEEEAWLFPLTQAETLAFCGGRIERQRQVKIAGNIFSTAKSIILIADSIIKTVF